MSGAGPVVCFGEMLLRLSPAKGIPLAQSGSLALDVGGAEANVAIALASLGKPSRMITMLPDNPLGRQARRVLGAAGVETQFVARAHGRMGLYFYEPPGGPVAGRVTYDRAGSAFVEAGPDGLNFDGALAGAALLHMSGITPALGLKGVTLAHAAQDAAERAGVPICFDGNYRANLWDAWESRPREILTELVSRAQVLIGNHRDISLLVGRDFSGEGPERRREAAEAAFAAFPRLELIASTARNVETAAVHRLAARVDLREDHWQTDELRIDGVVDRIGTGDAFAAGLILRYLEGADVQAMAETALALAAMKHGLLGDSIETTRIELDSFAMGGDVRR